MISELKLEDAFVTFIDGNKQKAKVAQFLKIYESLRQSKEDTLSEVDTFTLRQVVKLLSRKFVKLVPKDMHPTLKMAA